MKNIALIVLWLLAVLGLPAQPLKVGAYNLRNYLSTDRMVEGVFQRNYPKPEAEKRALRAVIRALNADVLVLQEMGPQVYLDELRRDLKTDGIDYPHAALATAADADRRRPVHPDDAPQRALRVRDGARLQAVEVRKDTHMRLRLDRGGAARARDARRHGFGEAARLRLALELDQQSQRLQ